MAVSTLHCQGTCETTPGCRHPHRTAPHTGRRAPLRRVCSAAVRATSACGSGGGRAAAVRWAGTAWTAASASRSPMVLSSVARAQSRAAAPPGSSCGYCGLQAPGRQLVYVAYTQVLGACVRQQTLPLAGEEGPQHGQQASPEQHKPKAGLQVQVQCLKRIALLSHVIIAANAARALGAKKKLGALCWAAGNLFARAPHRLLSFGGE